jgi:predicted esterase
LPGTPVLIANGEDDALVSMKETERLASLLRAAGALVAVVLQPVGHRLIPEDIEAARRWL